MGKVNLSKRTFGTPLNILCRFCGEAPECLPHVLTFCDRRAGLSTSRHNYVLRRLALATLFGLHVPGDAYLKFCHSLSKFPTDFEVRPGLYLFIDTVPPLWPCDHRPDLVLWDEAAGKLTIIDIAIRFESSPNAFKKCTRAQETKIRTHQKPF